MSVSIPNQLNNFNAFWGGTAGQVLGIADASLPDIQNEVDQLKGAGIMGTIDVPILCQLQPMRVTLNFHDVTSNYIAMLAQQSNQLTLMAALQQMDSQTQALSIVSWRIAMNVLPLRGNLNKMETGTKSQPGVEFSIPSLQMWYNNQPVVQIDVVNYIYMVNGVDYAAPIRAAIGGF
jgi:P2 family phage contractile tail tube protein